MTESLSTECIQTQKLSWKLPSYHKINMKVSEAKLSQAELCLFAESVMASVVLPGILVLARDGGRCTAIPTAIQSVMAPVVMPGVLVLAFLPETAIAMVVHLPPSLQPFLVPTAVSVRKARTKTPGNTTKAVMTHSANRHRLARESQLSLSSDSFHDSFCV